SPDVNRLNLYSDRGSNSPMKIIPVALLVLLLPPQETADKAIEKLMECMDKGAFTEGRALAAQICAKFPKTPAYDTAHPYTQDNAFLSMMAMDVNGPAKNLLELVVMADG